MKKIMVVFLLLLCLTGCNLKNITIDESANSQSNGDNQKTSYRNIEERFVNPYFFSPEQERQDMHVQFSMIDERQQRETYITIEYLFSFESGDVYKLYYPPIQYSEKPTEDEDSRLLGYFYVNEEIIIEIVNFNMDGNPITIYDFSEDKVLSLEHGAPVCYANHSLESIEKYISDRDKFDFEWFEKYNVARFLLPDWDWEIMITLNGKYVMTDYRTIYASNNKYCRYFWEKGKGLVGFQYGQGVGGLQHDFFTDEEILANFLFRF